MGYTLLASPTRSSSTSPELRPRSASLSDHLRRAQRRYGLWLKLTMISSLLMLTLLVMRYYGSSESVIPEGFARLMHGGRDGKPLSVDEFLAEKESARAAQATLEALTINHHCYGSIDPVRVKRFHNKFRMPASSSSTRPLFIAVNLHNNEHVLPDFSIQLLMLIDFLGMENVFVSIYESGSKDSTVNYLRMLQTVLKVRGIGNHVVYGGNITRTEEDHRIDYLARVRNAAMQPLYDAPRHLFGKVLFLNDVFFCAHDMVELLYQSDLHQSDMTCGLDYDNTDKGLGFYDTWVDRDRDGEIWEKRPLPGQTTVSESNERMKQGLPFQVSCCWNGAAVLNAEPFYLRQNPIRFHRSPSAIVRTDDPRLNKALEQYPGEMLYSSCSGSEINTLCMDFARNGFQRAVVVPRVKVAYEWTTYNLLHRDLYPVQMEFRNREDDAIDFKPAPTAQRCYPMDKVNTRSPDGRIGWELM